MFRSVLDRLGTDRRRWTFLSGVTFGGAALGSALVIWGALITWLWVVSSGEPGFMPEDLQGLAFWAVGIVWGLGTPVLGAVLTGVPLWYVLVERFGVDSVEADSTWVYPLLGAFAGFGAGVLSHFVMWGSAGIVMAVGTGNGGAILLAVLATFYSLMFAGAVTGTVGALAGAVLGYLRQGGDPKLPSLQFGKEWKQLA